MHRARMTDAGATRNATARMSCEGISRSPRAGPPGYSGVTRFACIQCYMIGTRATGLVNSGLWVAMAIIEAVAFMTRQMLRYICRSLA
jgi:hypothetical protein